MRTIAIGADVPAVPPVATELFAHGNDEWYWIAKVAPGESDPTVPQTSIQARSTATMRWRAIARMDARVVSIGSRGAELTTLLDKNTWMLMWSSGGTLGQPLPRGAVMLAVSGDDKSLWALGRGEVGPIATTAPATTSARTTEAASHQSDSPIITSAVTHPIATVLYEWDVRQWVPRAILSEELLIGDAREVSLAIIGSRPVLAANDRDGSLRVVRLESSGKWNELGQVARQKDFAILVTPMRALLWTTAGGPAGSIVPLERLSTKPAVLPAPANLSDSDPRTVAAATGLIRLVYLHDKKLLEQAYNPTGEKRGEPNALSSIAPATIDTWQHWLVLTMLVLLTLFVFGPARKRGTNMSMSRGGGAVATIGSAEAAAIEAGTVVDRIAPPRVRLQAGVLDALPLILVSFFIVAKMQESGGTMDDLYDRAIYMDRIWMWVAAYGLYFLHTLISEMITGRTLGKWIFGLRVTKLDGTRPTAVQFLIRNFIRVLEFHLLLPLIVIVFSPLNQRIGDMAAGTVVLADDLPAREEEGD